jgi:glutamate racemase
MIGIFDSGVGGISIYQSLVENIPHTKFIYYSDQGHFPYGEKSESQIQQYTRDITDFLIGKGAHMIVVACNSATISAIQYLRSVYSIPFIGTVPAIKPAASVTKTGKIAVLLTHAASNGCAYQELVSHWSEGVKVFSIQIPKVVHLVENNLMQLPDSQEYFFRILDDLEKIGIDTLVLGCTHFIFLRQLILDHYGDRFFVMDPAMGVMKQTKKIYESLAVADEAEESQFFTSGNADRMEDFLKNYLSDFTGTVNIVSKQ